MSKDPGADATQLEVSLSIEAGTRLSLSVHNPTGSSLAFCVYHTPFEGMRSNFLAVIDASGKPINYRGMMAKRIAPTAEHFIHLDAGEARQVSFEISGDYVLKPGSYQVRFLGSIHNGLRDSNSITVTVAQQ